MRFLMSLLAALALLAGGFMATPAAAQAAKKAEPQAGQQRNYTGCYLGLHAGGSIASTELGIGGPASVDGLASSGPVGGVHGGCDLQVHRFLVGVNATYNFSKVEFDVSPGIFSASIDQSWSVGGRVGMVVAGVLLYVPAGYVQADMEWSAGISAPDLKGWYVGGGFELPLTDIITVGAEYRFNDYRSVSIGGLNLDTDEHSLVARLTVRTPDLFGLAQ